MAGVRKEQPAIADPFRCYVGRVVSPGGRAHVVECHEVRGRRIEFRLREIDSGRVRRVSMLELLVLLEKETA